jgi:signal transduction histidine kinase
MQGERLQEALASEHDARTQAETASRLKDAFLATVSHELRTPLNAILGWAATLNRHSVDAETSRKAIEAIERNGQAQARIVDDLLDFSGIVNGRLKIRAQPVALAAIVREAMETVRLSAAAKSIGVESDLEDEATVPGDPDRLRQIAWNLLSNAVKFTPPGGRIQVRLARAGSGVELQVQDTGAGIDPAFLPDVFAPFRQGDSSMTRPHGGLGLGLALVQYLAELHGGTIAAHSDGIGRGSLFTLKLPLAGPQAAEPVTASAAPAARRSV